MHLAILEKSERYQIKGKILLCVFIMMNITTVLNAEEYLVATPDEIEDAMAIAQPGDTLTMVNKHWTDVEIEFDGDGEEGNPILLQAQTPGHVIIDGRSELRIGGSYLVVSGLLFTNGYSPDDDIIQFRTGRSRTAKFCRLTNTAMIAFNPPSRNTRYHWVSLYGNNNRLDHCYFSGQAHSGVTVVVVLNGEPNHHRIDHNYFGDHKSGGGANGWETMRIGDSSTSGTNSRTVVESNYFYKCDGEIEIISNKSNENIFRNNTFVESEGQLTLRHGKRCLVEGNFFFGANTFSSSGVRIVDRGHVVINNYFQGLTANSGLRAAIVLMNGIPNSPLNRYFQVINSVVAFNTIVDCKLPIVIGHGNDAEKTLPPDSCTIANNLVYSTTRLPLITYTDTPLNMTYEGNIMFGGELGIEQPLGIEIIDPLLELSSDSLYRPTALSPAIGAAAGDYPEVTIDVDGQSRIVPKDIGADEVSQDTLRNRPITREDVVPEWVDSFLTSVSDSDIEVPKGFYLTQNYPNPFNPSTKISYNLQSPSFVRLQVYDILGKLISTLFNGYQTLGEHSVEWNAQNLGSGFYFYSLEINGKIRDVKKAILIK